MDTTTISVSEVVFREDLYPRIEHDPRLVQKYSEDLEVLPPIEVNQHHELIDGWHRWTAYRKIGAETIPVIITQTKSDVEFLSLAIERNAKHGQQLTNTDKRKMAIRLFNSGAGVTDKTYLAKILSVSQKTLDRYLKETEDRIKVDRDAKIFGMYLSGHTQQEIADAVGVTQKTVDNRLESLVNLDRCPKLLKIAALFEDDFKAPLYNVWRFTKSSNNVAHFGESEQTIVENLLYLYTAPFDLVVDPFAGGGSTIDICKKRLRRVWASDRKPIPERENDIRKHDIVTDGIPPLNNRWSDVSLTYLDPPYWKQAEGQYSNDAEDLANQSIEDFTRNLSNLVIEVGKRQSKGVIALLIQPTQWRSPDRKFTDHVFDVIRAVQDSGVNLELVNRVSCPYNSEQYNPQMVNVAKDEKLLLVLTRELIVWRCGV
mgnify:FL=1